MMQVAHIYPVANQDFYRGEQFVMILAHLLKKNLYNPIHFSAAQFIIMDNGLFEGEQISTDVEQCIELAEQSEIPLKEIIVPDAINDLDKTIELFEENLTSINSWNHKYRFMFVAQALGCGELHKAIKYINTYDGKFDLSIGISKLTPLDRAHPNAIRCYKEAKFPIHFLGIKKTFTELRDVKSLIRSCDTSQLAFIAKNEKVKLDSLTEYVRNGQDINLETDECNRNRLINLTNQFYLEAYINGLL